jgi:spore photoproduct lyase
MNPIVTQLVIERAALGDPLTSRIRGRLPGAAAAVTDDPQRLLGPEATECGTLFLMRHRGAFVKDFPASPGSPPCGEKYIITMLNCPHACSYCYLQSYLEHGRLVLFTDLERMKAEIAHSISNDAPKRITTGEMSDSLALDELTGITLELLPLFEGTETLLDVRTKSARIDHILSALDGGQPASNLVITWTLGPPAMIEREEPGTASLEERLEAMARALGAGLRVGVRFDPVVPSYADMDAYASLIGELARRAGDERIDRFEIGILRFPPGLIEKVRTRHPRSKLLDGEYLRDHEGKLRLYRPARVAIYRGIADLVRSRFPGARIELSMEQRDVWEDAGVDLPV